MLLLAFTLFALTALTAAPNVPYVPLKSVATHPIQLASDSSLVGAFDTRSNGFGFAILDANKGLSVYNSNDVLVNKQPLQTTVTRKKYFGLVTETLALRAPVKAYGERAAYMLVDNRTLVDRDLNGANAVQLYKLKGITGSAFDVDNGRIAYVKDGKHVVVLDKKDLKHTIATIPLRVTDKGEALEVRDLELVGSKVAITYRGYYQVVDFTNPNAFKTEIDVNVPYISTKLVTANDGKKLYHATLNDDGDCKAYSGIVEPLGKKSGKTIFTFTEEAKYEGKTGKKALIAINGRLRELMIVNVDAGHARVERFIL